MNDNIKIENFILECDNFFSKEDCQFIIDEFENCVSYGLTINRPNMNHEINDLQLFISDIMHSDSIAIKTNGMKFSRKFIEKFWTEVYPVYASRYSLLAKSHKHTIRNFKLQKIKPGEGYHIWHYENSGVEYSPRLLTFILYLNDINDAGETEFLYYPKRISPKTGKLILWPSGFTHAHRGNPPLSETKYILTGWLDFIE